MKGRIKEKNKPCPVCKEKHTYNRKLKFGQMEWPSQRLEACSAFRALSPKARAKAVHDTEGCEVCTASNHMTHQCNYSNSRPR